MKKIISVLFLITLFLSVYFNKNEIIDYVIENFLVKKYFVTYEDNIYAKSNSFIEYHKTKDFSPESKEDILDIFFTALNGGWEDVVFYCSKEYPTCIEDTIYLFENKEKFSEMNSLVHPYNSYERIILNYNSLGKVEFSIERLYSEKDIITLNKKVDSIISQTIKEDMDVRTKIQTIHDYIINTTTYDEVSAEKVLNDEPIKSNAYKANGPLLDGMAICGGYSDAMALFLYKFNIENYKLTSPKHVWNYVYIDNQWLHLDLTWDDPVGSSSNNLLLHSFFLITDEELKKLDSESHNYTN